MAALEQPLALPVSTTFEIANRTISEHIGPAPRLQGLEEEWGVPGFQQRSCRLGCWRLR
jgi:hypothetical protein